MLILTHFGLSHFGTNHIVNHAFEQLLECTVETTEEIAAYRDACIQESVGDDVLSAKALGDIARAKGMPQIASEAGLAR